MAKKSKDYFDIASQFILNGFKNRIKSGVMHTLEDVKEGIKTALLDLKRNIFRSSIELLLLISGIASLIIGLVMLVSKYLPLYYILISYGVIISLIVLLTAKLK